jgi:hypothetical protein
MDVDLRRPVPVVIHSLRCSTHIVGSLKFVFALLLSTIPKVLLVDLRPTHQLMVAITSGNTQPG